ncbi:hypothetical protein [Actinomyces oris]|uniref:hypothetical protein n=1 Tax=Actinomyces oris TaxID=544580 RepID=UPI0028D6CCF4|nr:hypothetical protein [Actinomyces oris]
MTALLVLLLAAASAVDGSGRVGGRLSRMSVRARLLVGVPVIAVLGVLVGWPILHRGAWGVVVVILVAIAWLCCGLVPRTWWERLSRFCQWEQAGWGASEVGADRLDPLIRLVHAGLLLLAVSLCVVVSQPLRSQVAEMVAVIGIVVLLAVPANQVVADILVVARHSSQRNVKAVAVGCELSQESGKQDEMEGSMRGGRWIGPLERILILLLASVEAPAAIAAIVAAKGVIRFPEISQDKAGQKAEEFLIGSFVSWILAVLGAVIIHFA